MEEIVVRHTVLCHGMLDVFQGATEEDAVRVRVQERSVHLETYPYMFPLPGWEGVERQYHLPDFAMCEALHFMDAFWEAPYCMPAQEVLGRIISEDY